MATIQVEEGDDVILVELTPTAGVRTVSVSPKIMAEKSKDAMAHAMKSIRRRAKKTVKAITISVAWLETQRGRQRGSGQGGHGSDAQRHHDLGA